MFLAKENKKTILAQDADNDKNFAVVSYAPQDQFIHVTLWNGDYIVNRVSLHIDKFLSKLEVPFSRNFKLDLELESDEDLDSK